MKWKETKSTSCDPDNHFAIDLDKLQSTLKAEISIAQQHYQKSTDTQYSPTSDFKIDNKDFVKTQFFRITQPLKKLSKKYLRPYEIIAQPGTLLFIFHLPESMYSIHPVFHMSMLKPAMSNSFPERKQLVPILVIIDKKSKYEISWIVDSKIDCWQTCKILYKMIWLGYEDTKNKFK